MHADTRFHQTSRSIFSHLPGARLRRRLGSPLLRGSCETLVALACFTVFGLACAVVFDRGAAESPYSPALVEQLETRPSLWLVDGFNVLHAGLLGGRDRSRWWTAPHREELLARASSLEDASAQVWVVFDGSRSAGEERVSERLWQVFAPSADDWLLERVRGGPEASEITVVTADRRLAARARHRGARVIAPREFLARCASGETPTRS